MHFPLDWLEHASWPGVSDFPCDGDVRTPGFWIEHKIPLYQRLSQLTHKQLRCSRRFSCDGTQYGGRRPILDAIEDQLEWLESQAGYSIYYGARTLLGYRSDKDKRAMPIRDRDGATATCVNRLLRLVCKRGAHPLIWP